MNRTSIDTAYTEVPESLYREGKDIGIYSPEEYQPSDKNREITIAKKRRMRRSLDTEEDPRLAMTLTEVDGILRWNEGYGYRRRTGLRRSRRGLGIEGDVVAPINLGRMLKGSEADVDVISHSRGGLVTRWWFETYDTRTKGKSRAVLVGSPLAGTSLASAPRLRAGINLLTNVAKVVGKGTSLASATFPILTVVTGLLRVLVSAGTLAAKTPILDAAVALIPGLSAQAPVSTNEQLNRLNEVHTNKLTYFAVQSNFKPTAPGWEFWKYFVHIGDRLKDWGSDMVFNAPNDLVVDTASMTVLVKPPQPISIAAPLDFGDSPTVHHTVYFRQPQTASFIAKSLGS